MDSHNRLHFSSIWAQKKWGERRPELTEWYTYLCVPQKTHSIRNRHPQWTVPHVLPKRSACTLANGGLDPAGGFTSGGFTSGQLFIPILGPDYHIWVIFFPPLAMTTLNSKFFDFCPDNAPGIFEKSSGFPSQPFSNIGFAADIRAMDDTPYPILTVGMTYPSLRFFCRETYFKGLDPSMASAVPSIPSNPIMSTTCHRHDSIPIPRTSNLGMRKSLHVSQT